MEEGMATHSNILAWRIPWPEEPEGYSPWDHKESNMTEATEHAHSHALKRYWDSEEASCVCVWGGVVSKFYDLSNDSWAKLRISLFTELKELFLKKTKS